MGFVFYGSSFVFSTLLWIHVFYYLIGRFECVESEVTHLVFMVFDQIMKAPMYVPYFDAAWQAYHE